jgi:hypothetical protein
MPRSSCLLLIIINSLEFLPATSFFDNIKTCSELQNSSPNYSK